ncbi:ABC transporter substrate-binding protein [Candidatus Parabeggiatoa sp. HSG14]|uniref:ABC transporter substrate-binding protein n=1 Tax=Candidatus Parabeggiatoa sp. HSG14 TaxID=3055593 RepID=UPI0025A72A61|nr:ABC transporter substrate-binding protein [Thiotrichales bacterium HSG14]
MKKNFRIFLLITITLFLFLWIGLKLSEKDNAVGHILKNKSEYFENWVQSIWHSFKGYDDDAIYIALVAPVSGKSAVVGRSMIQAVQLYIKNLNNEGGVNHKKVILDIFDDSNDANKATQVAQYIAKKNRVIAVIGHNYSACSINGGKIYKKKGIPAITPVSTHVDVTKDNEWYFRTVFNDDLQARFLATYAKRFLHQNTVSIIYTDTIYGTHLFKMFEKASQKLIDIKDKWLLSSDKPLEQQMAQIVNKLQNKPDAGLIFLATHAPEGVKLVKLIRDAGIKNPLMTPDSYASSRFSKGFANFLEEQKLPGYYTDGLYVSTPFIFDTANRQAHYFNTLYQKEKAEELQKSPEILSWHAFSAVDAAIVLIEAIKHARIQGQQETLIADREKIKEVLTHSFNIAEHAVKGNTGLNYFDKNGDALKSISMGVYKKNLLISTFDQLQIMPYHPDKKEQLDLARKEGRVLLIDGQYMYKTNIVYTGIKLNSISQFDSKKITYFLDFYLWFRFQKHFNPQEITFLNAVEPIQLNTPIIEEVFGKETYQLYRVKGHFKENTHTSTHPVSLNKHLLGISFRHRDLDRNHLSFVTDILGMELMKESSLSNGLKEIQKQSTLDKWTVDEINYFQGIVRKELLGNPKYLVPGNMVEYSTFNTDIWIKWNAYAYHDIIPSQFVFGFLIFSGIMTLLLIFMSYKANIKRLKYLWFPQIIFSFFLLLFAEMFIIHWTIKQTATLVPIEIITTIFKMLWWFIPAVLLNMAIERFFWLPLEQKTGRKVPHLIRFLTVLVIYLFALFGIIGFVFGKPITSLLATSGMAAMIIGLAIQMNLSNIFSGIALNIERSFRVGDWVIIGGFDEGKVVNMNWRVTQIETRKGYILSIPNSTVSDSDIKNFSYPDNQYWLVCKVPIDPKYDPRDIEKILVNAVFSVEQGVMKDFKPSVWLDNIQVADVSQAVANYMVFFKTENYQHKFQVLKKVWRNIWIFLNKADIIINTVPFPEETEQKNVETHSTEKQNIVSIPLKIANVLTKNQLHDMMNVPQ